MYAYASIGITIPRHSNRDEHMRMGTVLSWATIAVVMVSACKADSSKSTPATTPPATTVAPDSQPKRLVFQDMPLRDVLPEIGRQYNVKFDLASDTLGERRLTASFGDESLDQLLQILEVTLGVDISQTGSDTYSVQAKPSGSSS
jgi:hypothetical protein